ncbi:MAG: GNAT family N-acetyltransferase [Elusimicrobia bacterium]|nr:GNAT family N-acetyltransferase [Elusimicrobiota bacterium]
MSADRGTSQSRIRPAGPKDARILADLGRATFYDTYYDHFDRDFSLQALEIYLNTTFSQEKLLQALKDKAVAYSIAETQDSAVGFFKLVFDARPQEAVVALPTACLAQIYVDRSHQGKGLGSRILAQAHLQASARKCRSIWLGTWDGNGRAIRFYEANGYKALGRENFPITGSRFSDIDLIMSKEL